MRGDVPPMSTLSVVLDLSVGLESEPLGDRSAQQSSKSVFILSTYFCYSRQPPPRRHIPCGLSTAACPSLPLNTSVFTSDTIPSSDFPAQHLATERASTNRFCLLALAKMTLVRKVLLEGIPYNTTHESVIDSSSFVICVSVDLSNWSRSVQAWRVDESSRDDGKAASGRGRSCRAC